jgi:hypothetical protein
VKFIVQATTRYLVDAATAEHALASFNDTDTRRLSFGEMRWVSTAPETLAGALAMATEDAWYAAHPQPILAHWSPDQSFPRSANDAVPRNTSARRHRRRACTQRDHWRSA